MAVAQHLPAVYRIQLRPGAGKINPDKVFEFCIRRRVVGCGWALPQPLDGILSWEEYERQATAKYGSNAIWPVRALSGLRLDDLTWLRDPKGTYYLARITSRWRYLTDPEAETVDIVNAVGCDIRRVGDAGYTPGAVIASFRRGRTLQRVLNPTATSDSAYLWNALSGESRYEVRSDTESDYFALIDDILTEDLVLLYLQWDGWLVIPSTRRHDTLAYEAVLVHRDSAQRAVVQVKTGSTSLSRDNLRQEGRITILFQSNGRYSGSDHDDVRCISRDELLNWVCAHRRLLPPVALRWLERREPS